MQFGFQRLNNLTWRFIVDCREMKLGNGGIEAFGDHVLAT